MTTDSMNPETWRQYAQDDIESAEILLNSSTKYHIVAYHTHQSVEKMLKRFLMIKNKAFPFIHDLSALLTEASKIKDYSDYFRDVSFLMDLYSTSRYPSGDTITKDEASKGLAIANRLYLLLL